MLLILAFLAILFGSPPATAPQTHLASHAGSGYSSLLTTKGL